MWQTRSFRVGSVASTPNDIAHDRDGGADGCAAEPAVRSAGPHPDRGRQHERRTRTTTSSRGSRPTRTRRATPTHLALFYYNFDYRSRAGRAATSNPENPTNQCELRVGYVSSTDGGDTWSDPLYLASMGLPDIVRSSQGLMVGDYSTADVIPAGPNKGNAISAFAIGLTDKTLNQPLFVPKDGIPIPFSPGKHKKQKRDAGGDRRAAEERLRTVEPGHAPDACRNRSSPEAKGPAGR